MFSTIGTAIGMFLNPDYDDDDVDKDSKGRSSNPSGKKVKENADGRAGGRTDGQTLETIYRLLSTSCSTINDVSEDRIEMSRYFIGLLLSLNALLFLVSESAPGLHLLSADDSSLSCIRSTSELSSVTLLFTFSSVDQVHCGLKKRPPTHPYHDTTTTKIQPC